MSRDIVVKTSGYETIVFSLTLFLDSPKVDIFM